MFREPADREALKEFKDRIKLIMKDEGVNFTDLAVLSNTDFNSLRRPFMKETDMFLSTLIKVCDALGYQVVFSKVKPRRQLNEMPGYIERVKRIKELRSKHSKKIHAKRKQRESDIIERANSEKEDDLFSAD